ncbi:MAG TPA: hypothetical protein VHC43_18190 [Mycobacteriales bacterium]|nr:hypothetical protein [Mycobacteriales bacterium]
MTAPSLVLAPRIHIPNPLHHLNPIPGILSAIGHVFTAGAQSIAAWAFTQMTEALVATTQVDLTGWFVAPWRAMLTVAGVLAIPIVLAGIVTEALAGRPGLAVRRGVLLPLLIGPVLLASRAVIALVLALVNGCCALVVQVGIGGPSGYATALSNMSHSLGISGVPNAVLPGANAAVTVLVLLTTAFLCFVIWVELAVRAAMIYLLAAFIPLALAGLFWSHTVRWTRRLIEVLAAVILAQLVITVVMVLAAASLAGGGDGLAVGIDRTAVGLALLFLGTLGLPMTFRLVPHVVEASVAAGAGAAVANRVRHTGGQALSAIPHPATQAAGAAISGRNPLSPGAGGARTPPQSAATPKASPPPVARSEPRAPVPAEMPSGQPR